MSLANCLEKVDKKIASPLLEKWQKLVDDNMEEVKANRQILREYGEELNSRLNEVRSRANLKYANPTYTSQSAASINKSYDAKLRKLSPTMVTVEGEQLMTYEPVEEHSSEGKIDLHFAPDDMFSGVNTTDGVYDTLGEPNENQVIMQEIAGQPEKKMNFSNRMPAEQVTKNIQEFYEMAKEQPNKEFLVPYTAEFPNRAGMTGYSPRELANLFGAFPIPTNVIFQRQFRGLIENDPGRFIGNEIQLVDQGTREPLKVDQVALDKARRQMFIEIRDADGNKTGKFFSSQQQLEATDAVIAEVAKRVIRTEGRPDASQIFEDIRKQFIMLLDRAYTPMAAGTRVFSGDLDVFPHITQEMAKAYKLNMEQVLNSFEDVKREAVRRMSVQGIKVRTFDDSGTPEELFSLEEGKGLENFDDVHFALDPKATASTKMKLFMSTVENTEEGMKKRPRPISIPLKDEYRKQIVDGTRDRTVRTPEQIRELRLNVGEEYQDSSVFKIGDQIYVARAVKRLTAQEATEYNESPLREDYQAKEGDTMVTIKPYVEEHGLRSVPSFIGTSTLANFDSLYEDVTGLLAGNKPSFTNYMAILENSTKPAVRKLAEKLQDGSTPTQLRKEFVSVMTKAYTQYAMLQFSIQKDGAESFIYNANLYSIRNTIIKGWQEAQKASPIVTKDGAGNLLLNKEVLAELRNDYTTVRDLHTRITNGDVAASKAFKLASENLAKKMLTLNGVVLSDAAFEDMFKGIERYTMGTDFTGSWFRQWAMTKQGQPNGIFSAFMERLLGMDTDTVTNAIEQNNPLYMEPKTMKIIAKVATKYQEVLYNSSHKNVNGDNIWDYTLNTYLSDRHADLIGDDPTYRNKLKDTYLAQNNWLLKILEEKPAMRDNMELYYLEAMKKQYGTASAERSDMSDRDQLFMALHLMMNRGAAQMHMVALTHSDKTRTPVYMRMPRTQVATAEQISMELVDRLRSVVYGEFDRIAGHKDVKFRQQQYEKGKGMFYFLPEFNYENMQQLMKEGVITEAEFGNIWITKDQLNVPAKTTSDAKAVVDKLLYRFIQNETAVTRAKLVDAGLASPKEGTHKFNTDYLSKIMGAQTSSRIIKDRENTTYTIHGKSVLQDGRPVTAEMFLNHALDFVAMDYAMNSFLINTAMSTLIMGDPAQVFKTDLETTLKEYQKRLAGPIAPGKVAEWAKPTYKAIVLDDIKLGLQYTGLNAYFKGVNITDAQEYVTVQEHLDTLHTYGQITDQMYKEMVAVISPAGDYKFTGAQMKILMSITKPVYYGSQNVENKALLHDYIKSSALPLYPGFTQGNSKLDLLRRQMELSGISRAHFLSAQKEGAPVPADVFGDESLLNDGPWDVNKTPGVITLSRENWRIQQDVPHDPDKNKIKVFSQFNKLFVADLPAGISVETMDGRTLTRDQIREEKEKLRVNLLTKNLNEFMEDVGVEQTEDGFVLRNKAKLVKRMQEMARDKGYSANELLPITTMEEGMPMAPLFFTSLAQPMHNIMMSMVDKVNEVKVMGKSYVQASSAGIEQFSTSIPEGVRWVKGRTKGELQFMKKNADGSVAAAEVLIPFHFFNNGQKMSLDAFLDENGEVDTDKLPANLLEMIGIRIPTSKHNSALPIRIAGFLPENMGDTIIVPPGITTQMGSDFDVDKLYVYRRPYSMQEGKLSSTTDDEAQYFDLQWKVMTSPDMYDTVLSPLDKEDLKDEAKLASKKAEEGNFFGGVRQLSDFISQKDAKSLIGFSALTNTLLASIQHLNIRYGHVELGEDENGKKTRELVNDYITTFANLELGKLSGYGKSSYKGENRTKMDNIGIMMSEFLDHSKNRTIDKINLTMHTYAAASALMSLEDGMENALPLTYASRLLQQPIIREFNSRMSRGADMLEGYTPGLKENVFDNLFKSLVKKGANMEEAEKMSFTDTQLQYLLDHPRTDASYYTMQYALLSAFQKLDEIGQRMSEISSLVNQDVKGTGGDLFTAMDKLYKADNVLGDNILLNASDILAGERGWLFNNINGLAVDTFQDFLPHKEIYFSALADIAKITGRSTVTKLSNDVKKSVVKSLQSFVYSGMSSMRLGDPTAERARLLYDTTEGPSLAKRVLEAKYDWGKNNYFLSRLVTDIKNANEPAQVSFLAAKASRVDDQENVKGWLELLTSENPVAVRLGEDLLKYAYLTGGVQDASNFVKYAPFGYLMGIGWFPELREAYDNLHNILQGPFIEQWIRHNPEKTIQFSNKFKESGREIEGIPERVELPLPSTVEATHPVMKLIPKGENELPPYLSYRAPDGRVILYQQTAAGVFTRIDTLGDKTTDEYNRTNTRARSIIPSNRALADWTVDRKASAREASLIDLIMEHTLPKHFVEAGLSKVTTTGEELQKQVLPNLVNNGKIDPAASAIFKEVIRSKALDLPPVISTSHLTASIPTSYTGVYVGDKFNLIGLNPAKINSRSFLSEVLAHELMHWMTTNVLKRTSGTEKVKTARANLQRAFEEAAALRDEFGYQMQDIDEFVVAATTVPEFMKALNQIQSSEKVSLLSKVLEFIANMWHAAAELMGMKVNRDSLLDLVFTNVALLRNNDRGLRVLTPVDYEYNGQTVRIGVDTKGKALKVDHGFMEDAPEPQRQYEISRILSEYNRSGADIADSLFDMGGGRIANQFQREQLSKLQDFIQDPTPGVYILEGGKGIGKTTMVQHLQQVNPDLNFAWNNENMSGFHPETTDILVLDNTVTESMHPKTIIIRDTDEVSEERFQEPPNARFYGGASTFADARSIGPWTYRTPEEAAQAAQEAWDSLRLLSDLKDNKLLFYGESNAPFEQPQPMSPLISKMVSKLQDQRHTVLNSLDSPEVKNDRKKRAAKIVQLKKIDDDIDLMKKQNNLRAISTVGERQLNWIADSLEKGTLSPAEITTAWRVTDTWRNLLEYLYGGDTTLAIGQEIDPDLAKVSSRAVTMQQTMLKKNLIPAMMEISEGRLKAIDFGSTLKDMDMGTHLTMSLNRAGAQLGQEVDLLLKNAARRKEDEINRLIKRLNALDKLMGKDKQAIMSKMLANGHDLSLIQNYTTKWFKDRAGLWMERQGKLKRIGELKGDPQSIAKNIKRIWDNFWAKADTIGVYANVNELFEENGDLKTDISAERSRLAEALGSEEHADAMINEAQSLYHQFLEDREAYYEQIDSRKDEGVITDIEADAEKLEYDKAHSPRRFFAKENGFSTGDRYAVIKPRASSTQYHDSVFKEIMNDARMKQVYTEISSILREMKGYLPQYIKSNLHENFVPVVYRNLLTDMSTKEYLQSIGRQQVDSLTATEYEEGRQKATDIPIRFVNYDVKKDAEYSRDLMRTTELFGMMALHYKHMSAIKDATEIGISITKEIDRMRRDGTAPGAVLTNLVKSMEHARDHIMYKNARMLEGGLGVKLYSPNPITNYRKSKEVDKLRAKRADLEKEYLDPPPDRTLMDIRKDIDAVDVELSKFEGQQLYLSKIGDKLIGINQLKALGFNPLSGFANLSFGIASLTTYANGRQDFTMKEAMRAMNIMNSALGKWFTFGNVNSETAQKIYALMENTGMMSEIVDTQYGDSNLHSSKKKWKRVIDPYALLRSSDYYMKGAILVATMLHHQVDVSEGGVSKRVSLWDAYDHEGNWKFDEQKGWTEERPEERSEWEKFRNRSLRVSQIIMGNMDRNSPKFMNKYILGRLIGQFRASWLPEGWAARFEDEKNDVQLGRTIKGRYRTYADIGLGGSVTIMLRQLLGSISKQDPFTDVRLKGGTRAGELVGDSPVDMENMRRNFTGLMWTLSMMAAVLMLKAAMPDDDDDYGKESLMLVLNMMNRLNQDLQFYGSPDVANNLIRNAVPAFDVVNDYLRAVSATKKALLMDDYDWDQAALKWTKATPYLNNINKFKYWSTHDISTISR